MRSEFTQCSHVAEASRPMAKGAIYVLVPKNAHVAEDADLMLALCEQCQARVVELVRAMQDPRS